MTKLEKRVKALYETQKKFGASPFKWGGCDCAKVLAFHLKKLGYKVPKTGGYRSALGAKKRLKELGFETLPDLVDSLGLEPIAPASTILGDVVSFQSDDPIGGLGIVWGNGNMMAFHESCLTPVIMTMGKIDKAWRVL
jgi:hypothetical protein